jgi:hypothetical protein
MTSKLDRRSNGTLRRNIKALLFYLAFILSQNACGFSIDYLKITAGRGILGIDPWRFEELEGQDAFLQKNAKYRSFGEGIRCELTAGKQLGKIGAEAGLMFSHGSIQHNQHYINGGMEWDLKYRFRGTAISSHAGVVLSQVVNNGQFFTRLGIMIGIRALLRREENISLNSNPYSYSVYEDYGGFSYGFYAGFGFEWNQGKRCSFLAEINATNLVYHPYGKRLIEFHRNGEDALSETPVSEKQFIYKKEYDNVFYQDKPSSLDPLEIPFGALNINLGIVISLHKSKD